jgi:hypothetical protein
MLGQPLLYSRADVVALGFEARCLDCEGRVYLWHDDCGLCVDARQQSTTLIADAARLPAGPWLANRLGVEELLAGELWR